MDKEGGRIGWGIWLVVGRRVWFGGWTRLLERLINGLKGIVRRVVRDTIRRRQLWDRAELFHECVRVLSLSVPILLL